MFLSRRTLSPTMGVSVLICLVAGLVLSYGQARGQSTSVPDNNDIHFKEDIFNRANAAFQNGQWDQALELTERLANAPTAPGREHTHFRVRSRSLRAVIYAGQLEGRWELAEAYDAGARKGTNPQSKELYEHGQSENLEAAGRAVLGLAYTAHQFTAGGVIGKRVPLDTVYPSVTGPADWAGLARIREGNNLESQQQEGMMEDSLRKGMDDALAEIVSGDRAKARKVLGKGPIYIDGVHLALFLAAHLADGAAVFNRQHEHDPAKLQKVCEQGKETLKAAQNLLKAKPDEQKEKQVQDLQDRFNTILKNG